MGIKEISTLLKFEEFELIKEFTLSYGDRKTFRNFDNNNPHYHFDRFDVFLGADIGQQNINNEPNRSDFNQLTIADRNADIIYYEIVIVRKGDLEKQKQWIRPGMQEGSVYLVDAYDKGFDHLMANLPVYLRSIKLCINDRMH